MRNLSAAKIFIVITVTLSLFFVQASASVNPTLQTDSAKTLFKLGILKGYPDGSLGLQDRIKRSEFITLTVRMLGYDKVTNVDEISIPFKDIDKTHWSYNNIKIAYKYGLITGNTNNTITPDNYISYPEVLAVLVRALGYESTVIGVWPDNVINKAAELGITKNIDLPKNKQVTRGETSVIIYNSLTVDFKK